MATSLRERWLRPPQLRTLETEEAERHATWLELFFDLVFVVSIAEVVHTLEDDPSLTGFLGTAGLFVPIWWAWVGYTVYADRFDTDDLLHRVLMLTGMLAVIAMALSVHDALHGGSRRFALSYVAVRTIVLLLNARARRHALPARPLLNLYLAAFSASALLWLASAFVPAPGRYVLWAVGLVVELSAPWLGRRRIEQAPIQRSHIAERVGLFALIVLGESVVRVAQGAAEVEWTAGTLAVAAAGFLAVVCLWWAYFEHIDGVAIRGVLNGLIFNYAHLPLLAGLVSVAAGTEFAISETAVGELSRTTALALGGGTALYLLSLTAIHAVTGDSVRNRVLWLRAGSAAAAVLVGAVGPLGAPVLEVGLLDVVLLAHVATETVLQGRPRPAPPDDLAPTPRPVEP
jgi:low temperature requirement protein LtrA